MCPRPVQLQDACTMQCVSTARDSVRFYFYIHCSRLASRGRGGVNGIGNASTPRTHAAPTRRDGGTSDDIRSRQSTIDIAYIRTSRAQLLKVLYTHGHHVRYSYTSRRPFVASCMALVVVPVAVATRCVSLSGRRSTRQPRRWARRMKRRRTVLSEVRGEVHREAHVLEQHVPYRMEAVL